MANNEQPSIDMEIEDDNCDLRSSPFFADFDPSTSANPIGFSIPRPHRLPMDPEIIRNTIERLKKIMELNEPVQAI